MALLRVLASSSYVLVSAVADYSLRVCLNSTIYRVPLGTGGETPEVPRGIQGRNPARGSWVRQKLNSFLNASYILMFC